MRRVETIPETARTPRTASANKIGKSACQTLYHSSNLSRSLDIPLNTQVTINFREIDVDPKEIGELFSKLRRERFGKWASRPNKGKKKFTQSYVYTFENGTKTRECLSIDREDHNIHVNWLVYIPPKRLHEFECIIWDWVVKLFGDAKSAKAIHLQPITDLKRLVGYTMKGAQQGNLDIYASGQKHYPQGYIPWRRTGTSRNLGPTNRRRLDKVRGIKRAMPTKGFAKSKGSSPVLPA